LDEVSAEDTTEVLDSHEEQLFNKDLQHGLRHSQANRTRRRKKKKNSLL
jgi:hypothetical protein